MRIACPHCAAVYAVPDQVLAGAPRQLRCARCAFQWTPPPLEPAPAAQPVSHAPPRDTSASGAASLAVVEIPPRPALPSPSRPERAAPLVGEGRPGRARLLNPAPLGVTSFGMVPLDGDPRQPRAGWTSARSLGMLAGIVGWALTVAIVVAAVTLLLLRQPQIEALWPPSQRLYALLGMR